MYIKELKLEKYRNYDFEQINFSKGINIIYGKNGQGKTNIIEAIYLTAFGKIRKTNQIKEAIKFNEKEAHLNITIQKENIQEEIDVHIEEEKKYIFINKQKVKGIKSLIGKEKIVIFTPDDLSTIKGGPKGRRNFINSLICQIDWYYLETIINYNKILKQRNILLRQNNINEELLDVYESKLTEYGIEIIKEREKYIKKISEEVNRIYSNITKQQENIKIKYKLNTEADKYKTKLKEKRSEDIKRGKTTTGIHLDEIEILINNKEAKKYASQGQQRSIILAMKLAEVEIIKKYKTETPILLLDDILSELDTERQEFLISKIENIQTIITCTDKELLKNKMKKDVKYFYVSEGKIIKE